MFCCTTSSPAAGPAAATGTVAATVATASASATIATSVARGCRAINATNTVASCSTIWFFFKF